MNIASLCRREIISVGANASVQEAAAAMRNHHVGALAVTDPDEPSRVIGMVTDRDLVIDLLALGHSPQGQTIGSLCHINLAGVQGTATIQEAVQAMQRSGVRRLLVVQTDGALIGLVSADDLFEAIAAELAGLAAALRGGIAREDARTSSGGPELPSALYLARNTH